jgi:hypothetical protein
MAASKISGLPKGTPRRNVLVVLGASLFGSLTKIPDVRSRGDKADHQFVFRKKLGSQRQPQEESTTDCDKQKNAQDTTTEEQIRAFLCSQYFSHCYSRLATAGPKISRTRAAEMRDSFVRSRSSRIEASSRVFAILFGSLSLLIDRSLRQL